MNPQASPSHGDVPPGSVAWHGTVAYDGTDFHGWQIQSRHRTVQGEIAAKLRVLFDCPELRIAGTSRTDRGVHAIDQQIGRAHV